MTQSFGTARFGQRATGASRAEPAFSHADRVHVEMFRAIELLGRKLERSEEERERLARRLALIESSAEIDAKTGKLYLPAVINDDVLRHAPSSSAPKWAMAMSLLSCAVALFAVSVAVLQSSGPSLTPRQIAALDRLAESSQFAGLSAPERPWQRVEIGNPPQEEAVEEVAAAEPHTYTAPAYDATVTTSEDLAAVETAAGEEGAAVETVSDTEAQPTLMASAPVTAEESPAETAPASVAPKTVVPKMVAKEAETKTVKAEPQKKAVQSHVIEADPALPPNVRDLEQRAFEGNPEAQHDLATLYAAGRVVPQDYKRAVYWFAQAADAGIANAHYNLGVMFQQGLGVSKNITKAMGWYRSAAEIGHPEAMYNLGIAFVQGIGVKRDAVKGAGYFRRAAEAGVPQAAYNLGVMYESNFLGPIDTQEAVKWYHLAEKGGHEEAAAAARRLEKQVGGLQPSELSDIEPAAGSR